MRYFFMENFIDYLGNKSSILDFIENGINEYLYEGDTVLDLFAGSGVVSNKLSNKYNIIANDSEPYSATICSALLNSPSLTYSEIQDLKKQLLSEKEYLIQQEHARFAIIQEKKFVHDEEIIDLNTLYQEHETVWSSKKITPTLLREKNQYNLFFRYYGGSYFGLEQAIEIDSIIKTIKSVDSKYNDLLYSKLFLTINNVVFSRDGHMAQPLDLLKNAQRALTDRKKIVIDIFVNYLNQATDSNSDTIYKNQIYNKSFEELLKKDNILSKIDLVYADPPYTDMQYSRYYHILNVAVNYNYPELTKNRNGYTKGLYTEGRFQSSLSQRSRAEEDLKFLMQKCKDSKINLALSYTWLKIFLLRQRYM